MYNTSTGRSRPTDGSPKALTGRRLGVAILGIAVLGMPACDSTPTKEKKLQKLLSQIYTAYDQQFALMRPDYVVVTYPESAEALPAFKRKELKTIRQVLSDRSIRHELRQHSNVIDTLVTGKGRKLQEYTAYKVPSAALEPCKDGLLIYLNLDSPDGVFTSRHPFATAQNIKVRVWKDPIELPREMVELCTPTPSKQIGSS